ncbi:MAG TPA: ABC transporter substrate-binding protein [Gemmatimonadales bacterium]|nr:ABC transporter substrate-binding protein [Gemmatimonadales bacterium]
MRTARTHLAGTAVWLVLLAGCQRTPAAPPVIGVAYPRWVAPYVTEAESTLRRTWGDSATLPRFLYDTLLVPETADRTVAWTQELLHEPGLAVIVGPSASHTALAVAPAINTAAIPQLIPNATLRQLDQLGPWTFRLVANDSVEAAFLVRQVAVRRALRRVLVLFVNDAYGQGMRSALHDELTRSGLTLTAELSVSATSDFETLLRSEFEHRPPDAVIGAFRNTELAPAARALVRLGSRRPIFVSDGAFGPRALHAVAPRLPFEVYGVAFWLPAAGDTAAEVFRARFKAVTGWDPRPEDVLIHDALILAATGVRATAGDPHALRLWLLSLGGARPSFPGIGGPIDLAAPNRRPFHLGRFVGEDAVPAELP